MATLCMHELVLISEGRMQLIIGKQSSTFDVFLGNVRSISVVESFVILFVSKAKLLLQYRRLLTKERTQVCLSARETVSGSLQTFFSRLTIFAVCSRNANGGALYCQLDEIDSSAK